MIRNGTSLCVPALWWFEIANALTAALGRQRISEADSAVLWERYGRLPVSTDLEVGVATGLGLQNLALRHGLSAYDAAYLELAFRKRAPLATLDVRLRRAAEAAGVSPGSSPGN